MRCVDDVVLGGGKLCSWIDHVWSWVVHNRI
jgi:hypothetical protein